MEVNLVLGSWRVREESSPPPPLDRTYRCWMGNYMASSQAQVQKNVLPNSVVDNHCFDTVSASCVLQMSLVFQSIYVASMNHNSTLTKITCAYVVLSLNFVVVTVSVPIAAAIIEAFADIIAAIIATIIEAVAAIIAAIIEAAIVTVRVISSMCFRMTVFSTPAIIQ